MFLLYIFSLILFFLFLSYVKIPSNAKLAIGTTIATLIFVELFLRYAMPVNISRITFEEFQPSSNVNLVYEPRPLSRDFNSDGIRDKEYLQVKPENVYRIIVIGDSLAYGSDVLLEQTYAKRLEQKLNQLRGRKKYEVINLGVIGYRITQIVERLKEKGLKYNPDLVIYGYWFDDIIVSDQGSLSFFLSPANYEMDKRIKNLMTESVFKRKVIQVLLKSQIVRRLLVVIKGIRYRTAQLIRPFPVGDDIKTIEPVIINMHKEYVEKYKRGDYKDINGIDAYYRFYANFNDFILWNKSLKELSRVCYERKIKCLLLMTPVIYDYKEKYNWESLHEFIKGGAKYYSIPVLDLQKEFSLYKAYKIGQGDTEHPNSFGHKIIADRLFDFLISNKEKYLTK